MAMLGIVIWASLMYAVLGSRPSNNCPQSTPCVCQNLGLLKSSLTVDCQGKKLYEIPTFDGIGKARKINLVSNKITNVLAEAFKGVTPVQIDLSQNRISVLDANAFTGLEKSLSILTLKANEFSEIPTESLRILGALQELNIGKNREITAVRRGDFTGLFNLEVLSLKECSISVIEEGSFDGLDHLRELTLYENELKDITSTMFRPLGSLQTLDLGYNGLPYIPARSFTNLKSLSLNMNNFSSQASFHPESFTDISDTLEYLSLADCAMQAIPRKALSVLRSLKRLDLNNNQIRVIERDDFKGLSNLEHLTLDKNRNLQFGSNAFELIGKTLMYLSMREMGLKTVPLQALQNLLSLRRLDISGNEFESFEADSFHGICAKELEITRSSVRSISKRAFTNTLNNLYINLQGNAILNVEFLDVPCKFKEANVDVNCDCALYELLKSRKLQLTGKCRLPRDLEGLPINSPEFKMDSKIRCERNSTRPDSENSDSCPKFNPTETGVLSPGRCLDVPSPGGGGKSALGVASKSFITRGTLFMLLVVWILISS